MSASVEVETMRRMAWERAKGELNGMLWTFFGDTIHHNNEVRAKFELFEAALQTFVKDVEDTIL